MDDKYIKDIYDNLGGESVLGNYDDYYSLITSDDSYIKDVYDSKGESVFGSYDDFVSLVKKKDDSVVSTSQEGVTESTTKEEKTPTSLESSDVKVDTPTLEEEAFDYDSFIDKDEDDAIVQLQEELTGKGYSVQPTGVGDALNVTDNITGQETEIDLQPISFFGGDSDVEIDKVKSIIQTKSDVKREILSKNQRETFDRDPIEFIKDIENAFRGIIDVEYIDNENVKLTKDGVSNTFKIKDETSFIGQMVGIPSETIEGDTFFEINKFLYNNMNDKDAEIVSKRRDIDNFKLVEEGIKNIDTTIDVSVESAQEDLFDKNYFDKLLPYLKSRGIEITDEINDELKKVQFQKGSFPYDLRKEFYDKAISNYLGENIDVVDLFNKSQTVSLRKEKIDRAKKLKTEVFYENLPNREAVKESIRKLSKDAEEEEVSIKANVEMAKNDLIKLIKSVPQQIDDIASKYPNVKFERYSDSDGAFDIVTSEPVPEVNQLKARIRGASNAYVELEKKSEDDLKRLNSKSSTSDKFMDAANRNYDFVDIASAEVKNALIQMGGGASIISGLAKSGIQDVVEYVTGYESPTNIGDIEVAIAREAMTGSREKVEKFFETKRTYDEALKEGSFGAFGGREFAIQFPNVALAIGTSGAGSAIGLGEGAISSLIATQFGVTSAGQKYDELTTRQEQAVIAKKALDELEEIKDFISEDEYFDMKYNLERATADLEISPTQKTLAVVGTGLIEGIVTKSFGTIPNSIKVLKDLKPRGVQFIDDILKSNYKAGFQAVKELGNRYKSEFIEEEGIAVFTKINDYLFLGDQIDLSDLDDIAVTTAITTGSMNGPGIAYSTILSQIKVGRYRSKIKGFTEEINSLKDQLKNNDLTAIQRNSIHNVINKAVSNIANETTNMEADAMLLGSDNIKDLLTFSGLRNTLLKNADVESNDSYDIVRAKVDNYIDTLSDSDAKKYKDNLKDIDNRVNNIIGGINYEGSIERVFGDKGNDIAKDLDPTLTPQQKYVEVYKQIRQEINDNALKEFQDAIQEQETIPDSEGAITPEESSNYANLTEDAEGNFVFFHIGNRGYDTIERNSGKTSATSKEEAAALSKVGGLAMYYTGPKDSETQVSGDTKYAVKVPASKVYDFNTDPLGFIEEARARHKKENPNSAFDPNSQVAYVTKIAGENGFEMVVAQWDGKTRAQTTKEFKPNDTQELKGNEITKPFSEEYTSNLDLGFESIIPETKDEKLSALYDKINKERNLEQRYDDLYSLREDYIKKSQDEITKLIEGSDLSQEIKDEYKQILEFKEEKRRSVDRKNDSVFTDKTEMPNAPKGVFLDIEMVSGKEGRKMSEQEVLDALPFDTVEVDNDGKNLRIKIPRELSSKEMMSLMKATEQEAIAQVVDGMGVLYAQNEDFKKDYGDKFNPDFFKLPREGKTKVIDDGVSKLRDMFKSTSQRKQVDNALNALSKIAPDVEVILHESEQAYAEATGETGRKQNTAGTYDETIVDGKVKKVIHINPDKANARTVAHESFHAIFLNMVKNDAEAQRLSSAMIKAVYKSAPADLKKLIDDFAESKNADGSNNYDSAVQNEEKLAELIGYLATEYDSLPKPTKNVIKKFLDRLAKMFGMKPFTDTEVIDVLNTIAKKVKEGEAITEQDVIVLKEGKVVDSPIKLIERKSVGGFDVQYTEANKIQELKDENLLVEVNDVSEFSGLQTTITSPDDMLAGTISIDGKQIFEGGGGIFFVTKYGDVWASGKEGTANTLAKMINNSLKSNKDRGLLVLTKGADQKLISSVSGVNSSLSILDVMLDKKLISPSDFRSAVSGAVKNAGGIIKLGGSAKQLKSDINKYFSDTTTTTFEKRGTVVKDIIGRIAQSKSVKENSTKIIELLGGDTNKKLGKGKTKIAQSLGDLVAGVASEQLTKGLSVGDVYGIIEVNSGVEVIEDSHPSYPFHIRLKDGSKPKLILPKNRQNGSEVLKTSTGKVYKVGNVSIMSGSFNTDIKPTTRKRKQFIGVKAKLTADQKSDKKKAEDMIKKGVDPTKVKQDTGFEVGTDGKLRLELDTSKAKEIGPGLDNSFGKSIVNKVLDFPKLFKAYPFISNIPVYFNDGFKSAGLYDGENIRLNSRLIDEKGNGDHLGTLLHEIQHVIQIEEGFTGGGNPATIRKEVEKAVRNLSNKAINAIQNKVEELTGIRPELTITDGDRKELIEVYKNNEGSLRDMLSNYTNKNVEDVIQTIRKSNNIIDARKKLSERFNITEAEAKLLTGIHSVYDMKLYESLSGEVEARNVQNRRTMTEAERRKSLASETETISKLVSIEEDGGKFIDVPIKRTEQIRRKPITRSRKQIIGENAELSDNVRENFSVARQMETAGKDAKTIRISTGWEKGADGEFKYEIDDVLIKDDFSYKDLKRIPSGMYLGKLSDIIDNQKLFKSYSTRFKREMPMYNDDGTVWEGAIKYDDFPPISDIKVYFREAVGGTEVLGEYDQTFKSITINIQPGSSTNEQISGTLLHEVQHYIQSREGWQNGGNLDTLVDKNKYSYEDAERRLSMLDEVRMLLDVESYLESEKGIEPFTSESSEILDNVSDIIKKDVNKEAVSIYESYKDKYKGDGIDGLYEAKSDQENSYRELFNEYLDIPKRYKRLAGEVEARNVEKRRDMTPEQRRKTTLQETEDVAREDQIFFTEEPITRSRKQAPGRPSIEKIVRKGKDNMISDAAIRQFAKEEGYTISSVNRAIEAYNEEKRIEGQKGEKMFTGKNVVFKFLDKAYRHLASSKGFMPKSMHIGKEVMDGAIEANLKQATQTLKDLQELLSDIKFLNNVLKDFNVDEDTLIQNLNNYMRGDETVDVLPEKLQPIAFAMRTHIDSLSKQLIESGAVSDIKFDDLKPKQKEELIKRYGTEEEARKNYRSLQENILGNIGTYMTRSYEVFDNKNYKPTDEVMLAAENKLREIYLDKAEKIAEKENNTVSEVLDRIVTKKIKNILTPEGATDFLNGSKLASKKTSILKERLDIPSEIRALMGEYTDPALNYARSIQKMSALVANQKFLNKMKEAGEGVFFFTEETGEFNTKIAADTSDTMNPLSGMYTTKEIARAMTNSPLISINSPILKSSYEILLKSVGSVKYSKTILSPATHAKNIVGNLAFMAYNGYVSPKDYADAFKVIMTDLRNLPKEKQRAKLQEYIKAGIINQSATLGDIRAMFDSKDSVEDMLIKRMNDPKQSLVTKAKKGLKKIGKRAEAAYQAEDDFFKIVAYENEKKRYAKAFFNKDFNDLTASEAKEVTDYISEIVKNILPNYSRIGELGKIMKAVPVAGTFISFQIEAMRTAYNIVDLAFTEIKDPRTRSIGAKRLTGIMAVVGLKAALFGAFGLFGDDEEDELISKSRNLLPPWAKNSNIIITESGKGKFKYINVSASDPHGFLDKALIGYMRGDSFGDKMASLTYELVGPFFQRDILFNTTFNILENNDDYGRQIWNETDNPNETTKKIVSRLWKTIEPGGVTSVLKVIGSETPTNEIIGQLTGFKEWEINVKDQVLYKSMNIKKRSSLAGKDYSKALFEFKDGKIKQKELDKRYEEANRRYKEITKEGIDIYDTGIIFGVPTDVLKKQMSGGSRFSQYEIESISKGIVPDKSRDREGVSDYIKMLRKRSRKK
jgi:hypothetical protein